MRAVGFTLFALAAVLVGCDDKAQAPVADWRRGDGICEVHKRQMETREVNGLGLTEPKDVEPIGTRLHGVAPANGGAQPEESSRIGYERGDEAHWSCKCGNGGTWRTSWGCGTSPVGGDE